MAVPLEAFVATPDADEQRFKELFAIYREQRDKHIAEMEAAKEENLKIKLAIIEELKNYENTSNRMASIMKFGVGAIDVIIKEKGA